MSRLLLALAVPLGMLAVAPAAPVPRPAPAAAPALYLPTTVGARRTYQTPTGEYVSVVTAAEAKGGVTAVSVGHVKDGGAVAPAFTYEVSDRGLLQTGSVDVNIAIGGGPAPKDGWETHNPPHRLLKLPATVGETWEDRRAIYRYRYTTRPPERVTVPAGEFTAVPVEVIQEVMVPGGGERRFVHWYAPGVGEVKRTFGTLGEVEGEIVLKAFSPGK